MAVEPQWWNTRMAIVDVIPLGGREFLIQLFGVPNIPEQIGFGQYYEASCEIDLEGGEIIRHQCVVHRPSNRRNVVGVRVDDWLVLLIRTDLTSMQLCGAAISVAQYGVVLSEAEAISRRGQA
jgi:hypothetical protein